MVQKVLYSTTKRIARESPLSAESFDDVQDGL